MIELEMTPCTHCKTLVYLPFLVVDDKVFCSWECYGKWKHPVSTTWEQLEQRFDAALEDDGKGHDI